METNVIYNTDCYEGLAMIPDKSIDCVVTDPPYLFDNGHYMSSSTNGKRTILKNSCVSAGNDVWKRMSEFGQDEIYKLLDIMLTKMKVCNMYICCSETQVPIYGIWAREHDLHINILVWEKPLSIINKNRFSTNAEYIVRIYDFGTSLNRLPYNDIYNHVIRTSVVRGQDKQHPCQKPVELIKRFIMLSSKEGDVILDPFIGSGTTAIACIQSGRRYIGFELSKEYFGKAVKRIKAEQQQLKLF